MRLLDPGQPQDLAKVRCYHSEERTSDLWYSNHWQFRKQDEHVHKDDSSTCHGATAASSICSIEDNLSFPSSFLADLSLKIFEELTNKHTNLLVGHGTIAFKEFPTISCIGPLACGAETDFMSWRFTTLPQPKTHT